MSVLPLEYYQSDDVLYLSKDLLGKTLFTRIDGELTAGIIIETEAYRGPEDKASHAFGNRRTKRNEVMYHPGGICYVYRCYGIHHLFNIVTAWRDLPHAVLIRAIEPTQGLDVMLRRRKKEKADAKLTAGPGVLTEALGITLVHNGLSIASPPIWIEDQGLRVNEKEIMASPRVGVDYAGNDALLPWRFRIQKN